MLLVTIYFSIIWNRKKWLLLKPIKNPFLTFLSFLLLPVNFLCVFIINSWCTQLNRNIRTRLPFFCYDYILIAFSCLFPDRWKVVRVDDVICGYDTAKRVLGMNWMISWTIDSARENETQWSTGFSLAIANTRFGYRLHYLHRLHN